MSGDEFFAWKGVDNCEFNQGAEARFLQLVTGWIEQSDGAVPVGAVVSDCSFLLNVSPATVKRYIQKHTSRFATLMVTERGLELRAGASQGGAHPSQAGGSTSQGGAPLSQAGGSTSQGGAPLSQAGGSTSQGGAPLSQAGGSTSQARRESKERVLAEWFDLPGTIAPASSAARSSPPSRSSTRLVSWLQARAVVRRRRQLRSLTPAGE